MKWLLKCSDLYKKTGGVHTAALSCQGKTPRYIFNDMGRHNALDKAIGDTLLRGISFSTTILFSTGRMSSEMLHKVKQAGIPVTVSHGVPTHQAVLYAKDTGITVIGGVRGDEFTIYTHPERIIF